MIQQSTSEYLLLEAIDLTRDALEVLFDRDYGGKSSARRAVSAINSARDRTPNIRWNRCGAISRPSCWRGKGVAKDLEFKDMIDVPNPTLLGGRGRRWANLRSDRLEYSKDSVVRSRSDRDL